MPANLWRGRVRSLMLPGSAELGESIVAALGAEQTCVILENHGVVAVGADLAEAFQRFETFEFAGKSIIKAHLLGGEVHELDDEDLRFADEHIAEPEPHPAAGAPSSAQREAATTLEDFVRRGYRQRLFISTHGTFSARVAQDSFVITPHHIDRGAIDRSDLVAIDGGRAPAGSQPSHATALHDAIYRRHPSVGAVVNAAPVNLTASRSPAPCPTRARSPSAEWWCAAPLLRRFACS